MPPKKRKENEEPSEPDAKKSKSENGSEENDKTRTSNEPGTENVSAETIHAKKIERKTKVGNIESL